jgi:hypothetical protein
MVELDKEYKQQEIIKKMTNKITPKVKFKIPKSVETLGTIWDFLNPDKKEWDWSNRILDKYPKLKVKYTNAKSIDERKKIVSEFFLNYEKSNKKNIDKKRK